MHYSWSHLHVSSSPPPSTGLNIEHFRLNKVVLLLPFIEIELAAFLPGTCTLLQQWIQSQNIKIANEYFD